MKRKLYRAKVKNWEQKPRNEQWVYGYYVAGFNIYEEPMHLIFDPTTIFHNDGRTDGFEEIDVSTLCEHTGLSDKNECNIWENDIVTIPSEDGFFVVHWSDTEACFEMENDKESLVVTFDHYWAYEVEVVGNVYDNSEFLPKFLRENGIGTEDEKEL